MFHNPKQTRAIASHKKMHHKKMGTVLCENFILSFDLKNNKTKTAVRLSTCTSMVLL